MVTTSQRVEFGIDLDVVIRPISSTIYSMTLIESKELKKDIGLERFEKCQKRQTITLVLMLSDDSRRSMGWVLIQNRWIIFDTLRQLKKLFGI